MFKSIILFIYLLLGCKCFITNQLYKPIHIDYSRSYNIIMLNQCKPSVEFITKIIPEDKHDEIVKSITSFLPKVDGIGGFVLHMNDVFINKILHYDLLSPNIKKSLILLVINISQMGDAAGHNILQYYYDIVDCLL